MNRIDLLIQSYSKFIGVPWKSDIAAAQRVIFCVYNENDELRLQARLDEFEIETRKAEHAWNAFDLTDTFADWLSSQRYAEKYFKQPHLLPTLLPKYLAFIEAQFKAFLERSESDENAVVALKGVGSLFGLLKVKELVDTLAPFVSGRLLVFFPGDMPSPNNFRLLDGYDGWNYHAIPITAANQEF